MKKYFLPEKGNFYKANLHLHSKISDGALTPEEWKEKYMARGYSILAYTDHDTFVTHNDLTDEHFLALNGYELALGATGGKKTCHLCAIRLTNSEELPACLSDGLWILDKQNKPRPTGTVGYYNGQNLSYTGECISRICQDHVDSGFFVTYNHPTWSGEIYTDYISYNNMHAMEMVNYSCVVGGDEEYNARVYDDMLLAGKRIYCIDTDDAHGEYGAYGGFTVIKAEKLEYNAVMDAMLKGHFYASEGPEIKEFYYEDGYMVIKTSPVREISAHFLGARLGRKAKRVYAKEGEYVTEMRVAMDSEAVAFRFTAIDERGKHANTNAVFTDTLEN